MNPKGHQVIEGDCLLELAKLAPDSVDLAYLDPPFFTNREHHAVTRDRSKRFSFRDIWEGLEDYADFIAERLVEVRRVLKSTGSVFVHCDSSANFLLRAILNNVFGESQFRSEIVWTYKRWSNSSKGLMPAHQTILFYSKTDDYKFRTTYCAYSETTNIDQILQLRGRDEHGVSSYAKDTDGNVLYSASKNGVPLSDVWDIPFLNPKAKERVGYPTQKPILLLERIIALCTDTGDMVLDPFCGSGTSLVAAKILGRTAIGIDSSPEAAALARQRLLEPIKTESALMKKGRAAYLNLDSKASAILSGLDIIPVQRNSGIDAFLKVPVSGFLVPLRVQREGESLAISAEKLARAAASKNARRAILVRTHHNDEFFVATLPTSIELVDATSYQVMERISKIVAEFATNEAANKALQPTALPPFGRQGRG